MTIGFDDTLRTADTRRVWDDAREQLGLIEGAAVNIGDLATTRHTRNGDGDHVAVRWLGRGDTKAKYPVDITYEMLDHRTSRFAGALRQHGIEPGAGVATLAGRVPELYVAALGALKAQCVYAPLFSTFGPEPVAQRLEIGAIRVLVTTPVLFRRTVAKILDRLPDLELVLIVGATEDSFRDVFPSGPGSPTVMSFGVFIGEGRDDFDTSETVGEHPALLHFTSGTTGALKGAVHVHEAVVASAANAGAVLDLGPDDVYWCTADQGGVTGTSYGMIAPLVLGATMIVDEAEFDARRWYRILTSQRVDVFSTAPTAIRMLQRIGADSAPESFPDLRLVASVGEPLDAESVLWANRVFGVQILDTERTMTDTRTHLSEFAMPTLGADMDEGSIIEWLVAPGDWIERGQVVARVETEKSDIDIEIWQEGTVAEIVVEPNRTVPVGTTLLRVATGVHSDITQPASRGEVWSTPLARHLAGDRGIDVSEVPGSGPEGAVRAIDLERVTGDAPWTPPTVQPSGSSESAGRPRPSRADRMRSVIAVRMDRSNREIPHYRLQRDVDLGGLLEQLASINESRPVADRIVPAAAFVRAVAIAADRHRELNGTWSDGDFRPGHGVNVSVAISLRGGGLVTPTIRHADTKSLDDIMSMIKEFASAARTGTMRSEWTASDSSITVTNLGELGADLVHGLISPPEVALVGFGRVMERPWVVDGNVVPRTVVTVTLGADHRVTDGAAGSRFLATLANALEEPEQL